MSATVTHLRYPLASDMFRAYALSAHVRGPGKRVGDMHDHTDRQRRVTFLAGGVLSAALLSWGVAACGNEDDHERCVDSRTDTVIDDNYCTDTSTSTGYAHWYRGGSGFKVGSHVSGGETGLHGVSRGGFGSHGGSEGGEGGHGG